jgi:hypothetical protein
MKEFNSMSTSSPSSVAQPGYQNVQVTVTRVASGGNAGNGKYQVSCSPNPLVLNTGDMVVSYQLISPTPTAILFTGMTTQSPTGTAPQLSPVVLSLDAKLMAFIDTDNEHVNISTTLDLSDGGTLFAYDPEVSNDPNRTDGGSHPH